MEDLTWRRATRSGSGNNDNCVEVATRPDAVLVRDSKNPDGPKLAVSPGEWAAFVHALK